MESNPKECEIKEMLQRSKAEKMQSKNSDMMLCFCTWKGIINWKFQHIFIYRSEP